MVIKIIIIIFIVFALSRVFLRFRERSIQVKEFLFWILFWGAILVVVIWPEVMSRVADLMGIGRGVDVAVYFSILFIFYALFKIFVRIEKMERDITKVVREIALQKKKD